MRLLPVLLVALLVVPMAGAHHPGSVQGLSEYEPTVQQLVHRLHDVQMSFEAWEEEFPDEVDTFSIGATGTDLPLEGIRITNESLPFDAAPTATGQKIRVYLDGGHHGNEFLGVDLIMYYLEMMLRDGFEDFPVFFDTHELYAVPIINPEGNYADTRKNANLVDLNRNYDYEWGGPGSGSSPLDFTYRGPSAFSEPESAANAEFARSIMPDVWITMHTGVAEFYWPWGWTYDKAPDHEFFESIEGTFENATNGVVDAMMAAELYLAAGATDDWGYGQLGIPTHTFEVHNDQNVPLYGEGVSAELEDQLSGLHFVVDNSMHWGAWLVFHQNGDTFHIYNEGWGKAVNVTLTFDNQTLVYPEIGPGNMTAPMAIAGPAEIAYRQLIIDAPEAKTRIVQRDFGYVQSEPVQDSEAPGVTALWLVGALAALAMLRSRRD